MKEKRYGIILGISGAYTGRRMRLASGQTVWFGRDERNDTVLEGEEIAPLQCGISYDGFQDCFWVQSETEGGVRTGMGAALPAGLEQKLRPGQELVIGRGTERFLLQSEAVFEERGGEESGQLVKSAAKKTKRKVEQTRSRGLRGKSKQIAVVAVAAVLLLAVGAAAMQNFANKNSQTTGTGTTEAQTQTEENSASDRAENNTDNDGEETEKNTAAEKTETGINLNFASTAKKDTSQGSYQSYPMVEMNGKIYSVDYKNSKVIGINPDGTGQSEFSVAGFMEPGAAFAPISIMATEQYLYICSSGYVVQASYEGELLGVVAEAGNAERGSVMTGRMWYEKETVYVEAHAEGFEAYSVDTDPGSYAEKRAPYDEETIVGGHYEVYDDYIYYCYSSSFERIPSGGGSPEIILSETTWDYMNIGHAFSDGWFYCAKKTEEDSDEENVRILRCNVETGEIQYFETESEFDNDYNFAMLNGELVYEYWNKNKQQVVKGIAMLNPEEGTYDLVLQAEENENVMVPVSVPGATRIYYYQKDEDRSISRENGMYSYDIGTGETSYLGDKISLWWRDYSGISW